MKKKLLVVSTSYPLEQGDINGVFVHELSKRVCNEFDVMVLAPAKQGYPNQQSIEGVRIFRHPQFIWNVDLAYGIGIYEKLKKQPLLYFCVPFFFIYQFLWIIKICRQHSINLIHAHWLIPNAFIAVLYKIINKKIKILCTIHGSDFLGLNNGIGFFLKKFTLNRIDVLCVVSNALKKSVQEFGYDKEIYVCPMGIDTNKFAPLSKNVIPNSAVIGPTLLYVGILAEAKGVKLLIEAMPDVVSEFPDCKLILVGDGILRKEMEEKIRGFKITNNVKFLGALPQSKLPELYANSDLFILPSYSEGLGVVLLEAISCKTLVLAADIEACNDVILNETNGFTFKTGNLEDLKKKIIFILNNIQSFDHKRDSAYKHVQDNFSWNVASSKYKNLLKTLCH